jgi:S-DNA-T family DNA segregation ATPase FtsK/SpoIIIE
MPVFADLQDKFHLVAFDDVKLSDKGNKWRPDGMTHKKAFDDYITISKRFKSDQSAWVKCLPSKLNPPAPIYDYEKTQDCDGWQLHYLPLVLTAPATPADYERCDLGPLQPEARFIGLVDEGSDMAGLIWSTGSAPVRIDQLTGNTPLHRKYAEALIFKTLIDVLPAKASVNITACTPQSKDKPIWSIQFQLGNGATVEDARKQSARIQSSVGAKHIYWEWRSADSATVWLCDDPCLDVRDISHWNRRSKQKHLIELALSDSWGVAGVSDPSGRTPDVVSLGALPSNHDVLLARFQIPAGLDVDKPSRNIGKFLTSADYAYGRILPRGEEHGSNLYDMVLAKRSPFPTMVNADWDFARQSKPRMFPLGVDDMGKPVYWSMKDTFHLLISGKSGTGKSSIAQIVVAEALLKGHDIILIDPSKGCIDFTQWAKPLALAFVGLGQMRETEAVIAWLRDEMAQRVKLFSRYGVGSIYDLDKSQLNEEELAHTKPIDIVFDEFNSYLQEAGKTTQNPNRDIQLANDNAAVSATNNSIRRTMSALGKIVVQGRTAGISVILGAQRLTMDDMKPYNANAFFRSLGRILLGMDSTAGIISAQNLREANRLQQSLKGEGGKIPQGRGIFETAQGELLAVQTWWSGGQEKLAELFADRTPPQPIDYSRFMPSEAETYGEVSEDELSKLLSQGTDPQTAGEEINDMDELHDMLHHPDNNDADSEDGDDIEEVDW